MQRLYVDGRLSGLSQIASASAAGAANPKNECSRLEHNENVRKALVDMMAKTAEEVNFGRKEAHDMYMDAYQNAETASEQIMAVNAMVKLHGLEAPKKVEVEHTHTHEGELRFMPTEELIKLAGMEGQLVLEGEFEEVESKPILEAPEVTEDNSIEPDEVPKTSGYG
jgi:phage I-like protein